MNDKRFVEFCNYASRVNEHRLSDCPSGESASGSKNLSQIRENFVQLAQMAADPMKPARSFYRHRMIPMIIEAI